MGRLFLINLEGRMYICKHCQTHLAVYSDLISKSFHCRTGKAYFFNKCECDNRGERREEDDDWNAHCCRHILCAVWLTCGMEIQTAHEKSQKYKEGRFVLERFKVLGPDGSAYSMGHEDQISGSEVDEV